MTTQFLSGTQTETAPGEVRIWDRFVRLFHWSTVTLFALAYVTGEGPDGVHHAAGYALLALAGARIVWGFIGSRHARFADFLYSPRAVLRFLLDTMRFRAPRHLGHNPAGGMMAVALLAMIVVICCSGLMQEMDVFWGRKWVETVHVYAVRGTLVLVGLHLVGVLAASLEHRENLARAMITGRKRAP
ncbi:MAG: cytochrome b/b6 domain-containing protein [Rhizobiales bacterium]|nr:cytochrome b/b6 domain-containing protein [Hyphomicrobiales bacterium]